MTVNKMNNDLSGVLLFCKLAILFGKKKVTFPQIYTLRLCRQNMSTKYHISVLADICNQRFLPIQSLIQCSSPTTNFSYVSIAKSSQSFSFFLVAACICNVLIFMYAVVCILWRTFKKMKMLGWHVKLHIWFF